MLNLLGKIPFWLGWTLILGGWGLYNYLYDDTRVGHPNYKNSSKYKSCIQQSKNIYGERLEEAIVDPSIWQLSGYESASDYARSSQSLIRSMCD